MRVRRESDSRRLGARGCDRTLIRPCGAPSPGGRRERASPSPVGRGVGVRVRRKSDSRSLGARGCARTLIRPFGAPSPEGRRERPRAPLLPGGAVRRAAQSNACATPRPACPQRLWIDPAQACGQAWQVAETAARFRRVVKISPCRLRFSTARVDGIGQTLWIRRRSRCSATPVAGLAKISPASLELPAGIRLAGTLRAATVRSSRRRSRWSAR
ncbi:hypothetical protein GGR77_000190 [Xanthomonas translucens]